MKQQSFPCMSKKSGPTDNSELVRTVSVKKAQTAFLLVLSVASAHAYSQSSGVTLAQTFPAAPIEEKRRSQEDFIPTTTVSSSALTLSIRGSEPGSVDGLAKPKARMDADSRTVLVSSSSVDDSQTAERNRVLQAHSMQQPPPQTEQRHELTELEQQLAISRQNRVEQARRDAEEGARVIQQARNRMLEEQHRQLNLAQDRLRRFNERVDQLSEQGRRGIRRNDQRGQAVEALQAVMKLAPNDERYAEWKQLLAYGYYELALEKGAWALKQRSASRARRAYAQALRYEPDRYEAYVGLAEAAMISKRSSAAVGYMKKALERLHGVPPERMAVVRARFRAIRAVYLTEIAEKYQTVGNHEARIKALKEAARLAPENPLAFYHWSMACIEAGRLQEALAVYADIDRSFYEESAWAYPYALVLYRLGRIQEALLLLEGAEGKSNEALAFESRIRTEHYVGAAKKLAQEKSYEEALEQLELAANDAAWIRELKAQWSELIGDDDQALRVWETLFGEKAYWLRARLGAAQLHIKHERFTPARELLHELAGHDQLSIGQAHRVALGLVTVGEKAEAVDLYNKYAGKLGTDADEEGAVFSRDRGDLLREVGDVEGALGAYRQAFVNAGLVKAYPVADEVFTRAMMTPGGDDGWLADSLRRRSADLYQDRNIIITASADYLRSEGSEGYSDLRASVGILQGQFPAFGGRMTLRQSTVRYDVGTIEPGWSGLGFCPNAMQSCNRIIDQKRWGTALSLAWSGQKYRFDIGTTPIGFHYVDLVGGISGKFMLGQVAGTWEVYRRAKESSLLAFGGQQDPVTGRWWGGVRRTGVAVNLGFDPGHTFGGWTRASFEILRGRHVAHNWDWQLMAGGYARLINKPNHELALGLSGMFWGFERDLSDYAYGQGGYYSPQLAFSSALSVTDSGRTENFAWKLQARAGWGYNNSEPQRRYPLGAIKPEWNSISSRYSSGNSVSHSFDAAFERRLNSHLVLGAVFSAYRSPSYQPTYGMVYLRWYVNGWRGDMPMPPMAPTPLVPW